MRVVSVCDGFNTDESSWLRFSTVFSLPNLLFQFSLKPAWRQTCLQSGRIMPDTGKHQMAFADDGIFPCSDELQMMILMVRLLALLDGDTRRVD